MFQYGMFRYVYIGAVWCLEVGLHFGGGEQWEGSAPVLLLVVVVVGFLLVHGCCSALTSLQMAAIFGGVGVARAGDAPQHGANLRRNSR